MKTRADFSREPSLPQRSYLFKWHNGLVLNFLQLTCIVFEVLGGEFLNTQFLVYFSVDLPLQNVFLSAGIYRGYLSITQKIISESLRSLKNPNLLSPDLFDKLFDKLRAGSEQAITVSTFQGRF